MRGSLQDAVRSMPKASYSLGVIKGYSPATGGASYGAEPARSSIDDLPPIVSSEQLGAAPRATAVAPPPPPPPHTPAPDAALSG
eukprot:2067313-Prymnesium_polylepis.1